MTIDDSYNSKCKDNDVMETNSESNQITLDCDVTLVSVLNADPIYKWYPETKLDKAKQYYSLAVELYKKSRYLDSFYLFQPAYKLSVLGKWT